MVGLFSSLFKNKDSKYFNDVVSYIIDQPKAYNRGRSTVEFGITDFDEKQLQAVVILVWQPLNHTFLHITYDVKDDTIIVKAHDGHVNASPGSIRRAFNGKELIIIWDISKTFSLGDFNVNTMLFTKGGMKYYDEMMITIWENDTKEIKTQDQQSGKTKTEIIKKDKIGDVELNRVATAY